MHTRFVLALAALLAAALAWFAVGLLALTGLAVALDFDEEPGY